MVPAVLALLAQKGLSLLSDAVIAKGKSAIEAKLGVKLPTTEAEVTPEVTAKLLDAQNAHEQFLITAALEEKKVDIAADEAANKEVTGRWQADMAGDVRLAKLVRPSVLLYLLGVYSIAAIASLFGYVLPAAYLELLKSLLEMVFTAYFVGRSTEKVATTVAAVLAARVK